MRVNLAQPRGFCAGVVRAIDIVERSLEKFGAPVYVRHEIVHNKWVVDALKARGARFVEDLSEVPPDALPWLLGVCRKVLANQRRGDGRRRDLQARLRGLAPEALPDMAEASAEAELVRT